MIISSGLYFKLQVELYIKMFLAFSLLLVGWQACYAVRHEAYPSHDAYPVYPSRKGAYPTHHDVRPSHHDVRPLRSVQYSKDFSFGVATSAYQVEGAWNEDGKGESIWDRFVHTHPDYANGDNGDVAADAYWKFREDVDLLDNLNVTHYRMSLSWPSILPNGLTSNINQNAVKHYREQFKLLRERNIEPFVTLYYWDLPQHLQDMGGFENKLIVDWFAKYARLAFDLFGHQVKYWSTFNEPYQICAGGYGSKWLAPAINKSGVADYICGHNLLKAHAAAWHIYDKEFRSKQGGRVSINIGSGWIEPASDSEEDRLAAETQRQFSIGWFAHPIYNGNYPEVMRERIRERCGLQGIEKSRLPEFSKAEIEFIKGTHDYFSLNVYRVLRVQAIDAPLHPISLQYDIGTKVYPKKGDNTYGVRKLLSWIKEEYGNPSIFLTGNGFGMKSTALEDPERITYIRKILNNVYDSLVLDDVRVYGYTYAPVMDSFEWAEGYSIRYGLYRVDFKDPKRTRTPRTSALWYKQVCSTGYTGEIRPHKKEY